MKREFILLCISLMQETSGPPPPMSPAPPVGNQVPLDSGIAILLVAAILLGIGYVWYVQVSSRSQVK
ncbi:hypothetical protein [Nonlabens ponticola]|uniref:Uncharacterized protein n=1 Tax=Nonlabens ponticola TaxID=2496866 RepID=A0A3S9MVM2_9FLAO|nr:hypothetical protein [Nonlabens ponticola]AZQ43177.1 hypothetical protein EJ995_02610 [Nonlabens ponticola]